MKKKNLKNLKSGDYVLVLSSANISFAGYVESIEQDEDWEYLVFQPSADSPLWIKIRSDFIKDLTVLIEKDKVISSRSLSNQILSNLKKKSL